MIKTYTDRMLEWELDGNIVILTPKAPIWFSMIVNRLFPPGSLKYSVGRVFTALRQRAIKKDPKLTNKIWWEKWLRTLNLPEHEDFGPDEEPDPNETPNAQQKKEEEKSSCEAKTASFLQELCNKIIAAFPSLENSSRQWTSYFHTRPVATDDSVKMPRKPDISCMKSYHPVEDWRRKGFQVSWQIIESITEEKLRRKNNRQFLNEVATDTYNKVYLKRIAVLSLFSY